MEVTSSESANSQTRLLQLLTAQNETLVKILEKQNDMMEKIREDQNAKIEELMLSVKTLMENSSLDSEIVTLIKNQNETMKEVALAVKTLEKNSKLDHDDQPFPYHALSAHESGWRSVFETLTTKMKDQVERWRNGMDSTLIFVALFVTVITSFQTPVSQNLSPNPADLTNDILGNLTMMVYEIAMLNGLKVPGELPQPEPFRPDRTDQVVTLFWYTALLLSLITAILSVFGRQWVEHLTKRPDGQSYKDRSWRMDIREKLAEKLLRPLLDSLHPILIVSIVLFIVGLLYQLWSVSFSTGKPVVLMLTSSLGSALILGTATVMVYTFAHGVRREESPFTTSTSLGIRRRLAPRHVKAISKVDDETDLHPLFCTAVKQMGELHHFDQISSVSFWRLLWSNRVDKIELAVDTIVSVLESDASLKAKQTVAWNLCTSDWRIDKQEVREKSIECHRRLDQSLDSAYYDAHYSQRKVRLTFWMTRMVVMLNFNGLGIRLRNLENVELKKVFMAIFKFDPEKCIDREILENAKGQAFLKCLRLEKEDPHFFNDSDINNDEVLPPMIVREDVNEFWKEVILRHFNEENVTNIFCLISTESLKENANCPHLIKTLFLVLFWCKFPFTYPRNFDISNLIEFATLDEVRFNGRESSGNVVLSCLSLMDDTLLDTQRGLLGFLDLLDGHEHNFETIRDEIPLTPASIINLRNRIALWNESA